MSTDLKEKIVIDSALKQEIEEPSKYHVIFLNDDTTPMDFVTGLLTIIFKHSQETAEKITLQIHTEGKAIVGTYTFEIAEQKTCEATLCARQQGFPLGIQMEKE